SFCMSCEEPIRRVRLIPIVGWFLGKGRCEKCGAEIGRLTLAGEVMGGLLLPLLLFSGSSWWEALALLLACGHLYISMATDFNYFQLDHENTAFVYALAAI